MSGTLLNIQKNIEVTWISLRQFCYQAQHINPFAKQWILQMLNCLTITYFIIFRPGFYFHKQHLPSENERCIGKNERQSNICLVGDGRCDSPGFSATYGRHLWNVLFDETSKEIVDFFIADVRNA